MNKLSLDALRLRAEAVASEDLLATISGGMENACHPNPGNGGGPIDPNAEKYKDLETPKIEINLPKEPWTPKWNI